jgi:hypothetical protein
VDLTTLRCGCGSPTIFSVRPGVEPLRRGAIDLFTRLDPVLVAGVPDVAWCLACWATAFGPRVAEAVE